MTHTVQAMYPMNGMKYLQGGIWVTYEESEENCGPRTPGLEKYPFAGKDR